MLMCRDAIHLSLPFRVLKRQQLTTVVGIVRDLTCWVHAGHSCSAKHQCPFPKALVGVATQPKY